MAIMNSIFAAQKNKVAIDSCVLGEDSTFLQQASEITGGTYVNIPDHSKLTQYLLGIFLMGIEFRKSFNTPPAAKVCSLLSMMYPSLMQRNFLFVDRNFDHRLDSSGTKLRDQNLVGLCQSHKIHLLDFNLNIPHFLALSMFTYVN